MEVEGFKKISDGDPEPAVGASVGEGVEHGVAEPALLVDEEPCGGGGEGVALGMKVWSEMMREKDLLTSFKRTISGSTRERKMLWMSSCGRRQSPMALGVEFR